MQIKKISNISSIQNGSVSTDINETASNIAPSAKTVKDYIDNRHSSIMLRHTGSFVWKGSQTITPFDLNSQYSKYGNGFSKSGNYVVVGKGVRNVKVTSRVQTNETNYGQKWMFTYIRKNNKVMCQGIFMLHPWGSDTLVTVFPVQEGDKIDLAIKTEYTGDITFPDYSNYGSNHGITYLKVESAD